MQRPGFKSWLRPSTLRPSDTDLTTCWQPLMTCRSWKVSHGHACNHHVSLSAMQLKISAEGYECCTKTCSQPLRLLLVLKNGPIQRSNGLHLDSKWTTSGGWQMVVNCWTAIGLWGTPSCCCQVVGGCWCSLSTLHLSLATVGVQSATTQRVVWRALQYFNED